MTSDGDQGIIVYATNVTIEANVVYSIQVVAVNVIGQGPVSETTLSEF